AGREYRASVVGCPPGAGSVMHPGAAPQRGVFDGKASDSGVPRRLPGRPTRCLAFMRRIEPMPRRAKRPHRVGGPEPKFNNRTASRMMGRLMIRGKRSLAEHIVYQALEIIEQRAKRNPIDVFEQGLRAATPVIEVKPRRVGGATYQVPVEIRSERRLALAMRWLIASARGRAGGRAVAEKLASELMDAAAGQGATIRKREETHKMADSNKAFAHYRW